MAALEPPSPEQSGLKIGELVKRTGVSREMVKYYLRAGLLPQPVKPRPNLSLYDDRHEALIGLILRFQAQTKLSLAEIAEVFGQAHYDPGAIELELLSAKHNTGSTATILPFADESSETDNLDLPEDFLTLLADEGLLDTDNTTYEIRQSAGLLWAAHREGIPLEFFTQARQSIKALADLEVKTMLEIQRPHLQFSEVVESITDVDRIINRWIISEKTHTARSTFSRILANAEAALTTVHDAIYVPSEVFNTRHETTATLDALESEADKSADSASFDAACRSAVLLADFERAVRIADRAIRCHPKDPLFTGFKCLALCMDKRLDDAMDCTALLADSDSRHPVILEARLLTMLMHAARLSGLSDSSQLLKEAAELFREPVDVPSNSDADAIEAALLEARAKTLFPDAFAWRDGVRTRLESLQRALEDVSVYPLPSAALRQVYQIYGAYYLGQLYEEEGDTQTARAYYEDVIKRDPASNFGEMAYLKLT